MRPGIPLSGYQRFLLEESGILPVLTPVKQATAQGADEEEAAEALACYQILQYYRMFDQKGEQ